MAIITLLTDFGLQDEYVAVMKGVMLCIHPGATFIDVSHQIGPQDVVRASQMLRSTYHWFPEGTVHLAVVDPGVGTQRDALACYHNGHFFVAPDNGLLSEVWSEQDPGVIVRIENRSLFLHPVSSTFHGRDVFAPVAAHLAKGLDMRALGEERSPDQVVRFKKVSPQLFAEELLGIISAIDTFGNLLTDIESRQLEVLSNNGRRELLVQIGDFSVRGICSTYADKGPGELVALIGSLGRLEIAVNNGRADKITGAAVGDAIKILCVASNDINQSGQRNNV